jgi:hypothetical protein
MGRPSVKAPWALVLASALAGCGRKTDAKPSPATSASTTPTPTSSATPTATADATPTATADATATAEAGSVPDATTTPFDAGVNACRLAYGPIQQPWTGAATLIPSEGALELVTSKGGVPTVTKMALPALGGPRVGRLVLETEAARVSSTPCAVAEPFLFCMDPQGAVTKTPRGAPMGSVVGKARPGTRLAAALIGGTHALVVYLVERKKEEGTLLEAVGSVDGAPPVRLSEDGSGATSVALAPRGEGALALLVDARSAMTPVHGRALAWKDGHLDVGSDAVVFVGGGAEPNTTSALGTSSGGAAFALVPIAGETGFGMAAVRIGDPPAIDEKVVWSMYPNGLDPAPIAATTGAPAVRVARLRPVDSRPQSPRGVELGKVEDSGAFTPFGMISTTGRATDLAVATDTVGALWVYYTDTGGSWLERRVCP